MIRRTLVPAWAGLTEILHFRRLIEQAIARTAGQRRAERDVAAIRRAVAGDGERAAELAAQHFSRTEDMLRELHAYPPSIRRDARCR
jgi:DNA-binding FadR family transcriptional regulator